MSSVHVVDIHYEDEPLLGETANPRKGRIQKESMDQK
jgi:hypothetical protein